MAAGITKPESPRCNLCRDRLFGRRVQNISAALRRRVGPRLRAPDTQRFAGNDAGQVPAAQFFKFIQHPAHDFGIGIHIRRRHVQVGSDKFMDGADIAARQLFSSRWDKIFGSTTTPPFPPPNGMFTTAVLKVIQADSALTSS